MCGTGLEEKAPDFQEHLWEMEKAACKRFPSLTDGLAEVEENIFVSISLRFFF